MHELVSKLDMDHPGSIIGVFVLLVLSLGDLGASLMFLYNLFGVESLAASQYWFLLSAVLTIGTSLYGYVLKKVLL